MNCSKPILAAAVLASLTTPLFAVLERSLSDDPAHISLATQYTGRALSLRAYLSNGTTQTTSAVLINNRYAIASYHQIAFLAAFNPTFAISNGPNFLTNPGTTIPISRILPYPGANPPDPNTADLALLELSTPVEGATSLPISPTTAGDVLTFVGFGRYGDPSAGSLPQDGHSRAARAPVTDVPPEDHSPIYYADATYDVASPIPLNGRGMPSDSGGPWFNAAGHLVGLTIAGTAELSPTGETTFLKLAHPDIISWLDSNARLPGDTNDDGVLTPDDYALIDRAYATNLSNPRRTDGDFNHDGAITSADYLIIDQAFLGQAQGFSPGFLAQRQSQFGPAYVSQLLSNLPEPSIMTLPPILLLYRRRHPR